MIERIRKQLKLQQGFTLIELLVVIAIIGVLAAIAIPKFADATATSGTAKIQADLSAIDTASQLYQANNAGSLPKDVAALVTANLLTSTPKPPDKAMYKGKAESTSGSSYGINSDGRATISAIGSDSNVIAENVTAK